MAIFPLRLFPISTMVLVFLVNYQCHVRASSNRQAYVVTLEQTLKNTRSLDLDILKKVLEESTPEQSLIYTYREVINGFAARLTSREAKKLQSITGVAAVFPSKSYRLMDKASWDSVRHYSTLEKQATRKSHVKVDETNGKI